MKIILIFFNDINNINLITRNINLFYLRVPVKLPLCVIGGFFFGSKVIGVFYLWMSCI